MATVEFSVRSNAWVNGPNTITWAGSPRPSLGTTFSDDGTTEILIDELVLPKHQSGNNGRVSLYTTVASNQAGVLFGPDLSSQFEMEGTITFTFGSNVLVLTGISDTTEPYGWTPSNINDVYAWATALGNAVDRSCTIAFAVASPLALESIANQNVERGASYSQTLPEATGGEGTITYTITLDNARGLAVNNDSRVISGTPTSNGVINVTYTATDSDTPPMSQTQTFTITVTEPLVAPSFSDDTGDAQAWTTGAAITSITVPTATGHPTPTYTQVGSLPTGLSFNGSTRVISGTPTASGTGTIRIRATNSQGSDDWTVAYSITDPPPEAPVFADDTGTAQAWTTGVAITSISVPTATGFPVPSYTSTGLPAGVSFDPNTRVISGTPTSAGSGTITISATNAGGTDDWTVAYSTTNDPPVFSPASGNARTWRLNTTNVNFTVPNPGGNPSPSYTATGLPAGVTFNANTRVVSGIPTALSSGTITIRATNAGGSDDYTVAYTVNAVAPNFSDNTGNAQSWSATVPTGNIQVPSATGQPTPTYAASGLPTGVQFNSNTRIISGTPTTPGSGTITVTATNVGGSDDWTLAYTIAAAPPEPSAPKFTLDIGPTSFWLRNSPITVITVPAATGFPPPTYAQVGGLPNGISFNRTNRRISGTPRQLGTGTITIRASNTQGTADWTLTYTVLARADSYSGPYRLEVDWDGDGTFSHDDANIWADVLALPMAERGRNYEDQVFGRSEAGQLRATLRNDDDKYNRFSPTSPLRGLAIPGRDMRFRIWNGVSYSDLWGGLLYDIKPLPERGGGDRVTLRGFGYLSELTQREVSVPVQAPDAGITVGNAGRQVLDAANVPTRRRGTIQGARRMARWWVRRQVAIDALRELEETELGFLYEDKSGRINLAPENARLVGGGSPAKFVINADAARDIPVDYIRPVDPVKDIANVIAVPVRNYTVDNEAVLWTLRRTVALESGESLSFLAEYPNDSTSLAVLGVDSWTDMAATIDYRANIQADGLGANRTSSLSVQTEDALLGRRITVTNTHASDTIYIIRLQTRGRALRQIEPTVLEFSDADSIDDYGERTYPVPSQFISDITDAASYGNFLLSLTRNPQVRATVTVQMSDFLTELVDLELSDRVSVESQGQREDMFLEGISHRIERGDKHEVTLLLSPTQSFDNVIILGIGPGLGEGVIGR